MNNTKPGEEGAGALDRMLPTRIAYGLAISVLINIILWRAAASVAFYRPVHNFQDVVITRIVVDKRGHQIEKVITKKEIAKKLAVVKKQIQRQVVLHHPVPVQRMHTTPPPQGAHNRVLTALPSKDNSLPPNGPTALQGGNAAVGQPISQQNEGNAEKNPPKPPPPAPALPERAPAPPVAAPAAAPPPPAPPMREAPKPKPKPAGPTKDAEALSTAEPRIPDSLRQEDYSSSVRVSVRVAADGSFTAKLLTSSGNFEIDKRVLQALNKWKWKPALRDGLPVPSTQLFRFEFVVQ